MLKPINNIIRIGSQLGRFFHFPLSGLTRNNAIAKSKTKSSVVYDNKLNRKLSLASSGIMMETGYSCMAMQGKNYRRRAVIS